MNRPCQSGHAWEPTDKEVSISSLLLQSKKAKLTSLLWNSARASLCSIWFDATAPRLPPCFTYRYVIPLGEDVRVSVGNEQKKGVRVEDGGQGASSS